MKGKRIGWVTCQMYREGDFEVDSMPIRFKGGLIGLFPVYKTKTAASKQHGRKIALLEVVEGWYL